MKLAVDDDQLRISYEIGNIDVAIVAFAGVGHGLGSIQKEEFQRSLSKINETKMATVIYVVEKTRTWYNNDIAKRITQTVNKILANLDSKKVTSLGNSMGGFGAIALAKSIYKCTQAIAFCPQSSVDDRVVPFETRWQDWRGGIVKWCIPDALAELDTHIHYTMFFGSDDNIDLGHAQRFLNLGCPNITVRVIENCGHDVAAYLKKQGKLKTTLEEIIWSVE